MSTNCFYCKFSPLSRWSGGISVCDMMVRHVLLGQTWCVILSLVSVWSTPLCDISICTLLKSATAVFRVVFILFINVFCILLHDYTLCFTGSPCYNVSYYNYISI